MMEYELLASFEHTPYLISLLAGILTFISPCVLPLIPAYLSYITGMSALQLENSHTMNWKSRLRVIESALLFIIGFSIVFMTIGAIMAGFIGNIFIYKWIPWIAGSIIIIFGLHFIGIIKIKFLYYEKRLTVNTLDTNKNPQGFLAHTIKRLYPVVLGIAFALGWTPCIGPIFASIVALAADNASTGTALMGTYTLGLAIPFFISALLTNYFITFFDKLKKHLRKVEIISGILLIIIGVMIITGNLGDITMVLINIFGL